MPNPRPEAVFRFFDNHEKYLLFATTCSESQAIASRVGRELAVLEPRPPGLRLFQTGAGDGSLLNMVLRDLHRRWPTLPCVAVVRELSADFIRMAVRNLADRFREHAELVLEFTNARYAGEGAAAAPHRAIHALAGASSHAFERQIHEVLDHVAARWSRREATGRGRASTLVLHRADQAMVLDRLLHPPAEPAPGFDLVVASHAYRSRLPVATRLRWVLEPLARRLAPGGRMVVVQAAGGDPGLEIVHALWPGERPFPTPVGEVAAALERALAADARPVRALAPAPGDDDLRYALQLNPEDVRSAIGTSTLLAAWNAATYVAQIDEARLTAAMSDARYLEAAGEVLRRHRGLWLRDECRVLVRDRGPAGGADRG